MRIVATSDWHGNFPKIPECDLLLIAGDVCPIDSHQEHHQRKWLRGAFADFLNEVPAKEIIWIAGNHDFACQSPGFWRIAETLPGHYLADTEVVIDGIKIYGSPWVPNLPSWAFHAGPQMLQDRADRIPIDTDILLLHGPPYGILDRVGFRHVGADHVMSRLRQVLPQYVIFGHIHEGYGRMELGGIEFKNVAHVDEFYEPINPPQTFNLDT